MMAEHDDDADRGTDLPVLEADGQAFLDREDYDGLGQWLVALPAALVAQRPRLRYLRARWLIQAGQSSDAIIELEQACQHAVAGQDWPLAVDGYLWLARLHQRREAIALARDYLSAAEALAGEHPLAHPADEARFALAVGRLYPDLGDNHGAVTWCSRALRLFEGAGDVSGQVEALWLLAVAHSHLVNLYEARATIERALSLNLAHDLGEVERLFLLNVQAHIALYAGRTDDGLAVLEEAASLLARHPVAKPALYLAMAEGALRRQAGDPSPDSGQALTGSLTAYQRAEKIMDALGDVGFRPWLTMEWGWTRLLAGEEPAEVRRALLASTDPQNAATRRSVEIHLAVLDLLEGRWEDGLARLREVVPQFRATGELLSVFAAHVYLAYVHLQVGDQGACSTSVVARR